MRVWQAGAVALAVATGAAWFAMAKNSSETGTAHAAASMSPLDMMIPADLTAAEGGNAF